MWLPAVDVSAPGASGAELGGGGALALWLRGDTVEAAELAGTGPVLSPPSVPVRAVAGTPVDLSVDAVPWAAPLAGEPVWSFGDGGSATGASVRHVYAAAGTYEVSVTQSDVAGGTSSASARIVVAAPALENLVRPSIRGRPRVGATLTCLRGRWSGTPPIRYAYGWLRNARRIPGVRRPTYRIRPRDAGSHLACRVVASSGSRSRTATSRAVRVKAA
jgi:hypothetical protein